LPSRQSLTIEGGDDDVFVVAREANGDASCREPTGDERAVLSRVSKAGLGIHQLNHVSDSRAPNLSTNVSGGLTIILRATEQLEANQSAKQALIRAASNWEREITTPVTIFVDVDFGPTNFGQPWGPNVLGVTNSPTIFASYQNVRNHLIPTASSGLENQVYNLLPETTVPTDLGDASPTMSVSSSVARAIGLLDPTAVSTDPAPQISLNSNQTFDFDASNGITFGTFDFESVATHELGHALGFTSRSGAGVTPPQLTVWDLFRFRSQVSNFTTDSRIMSTGDPQVYFSGNGTRVLNLSTGGPNGTAGDMRQSAHWKDDSLLFEIIGIMDPTILAGQHLTISVNDLNAIDRFGYTTVINTAPTIIEFVNTNFALEERDADINVTIRRTGDTTGTSTVDYTTRDIAGAQPCSLFGAPSASSRCDYITTLGTLRFGPGETQKTITIPIIDDSFPDGLESFWLDLSNPTGAILGSIDEQELKIGDNDGFPIPTTNPLDAVGFFVREHYIDFLNREPDAGGLAFWTNEITQCGVNVACNEIKHINVSAAFFLSIEFQETGYLVYRLHKSAFGNLPSAPVPITLNRFLRDTQAIGQGVIVGIGDWQAQLETNKQGFTLAFVQRPEFLAAYPNTQSADQFVSQLDANAGGVLSLAEKTNLVSILSGAPSDFTKRAQVVRAVAEDQDLKDMEFNKAFVLMQYFGYLRRNPNDAPDSNFSGFDFWLNKLNSFGGNFVQAEMVKAFISSIEFRQRFGA